MTEPITPSTSKPVIKATIGKLYRAVTASRRLRAIAAAGITGGFAVLGLHVDGETALALITAAGFLAGWGPAVDQADAS